MLSLSKRYSIITEKEGKEIKVHIILTYHFPHHYTMHNDEGTHPWNNMVVYSTIVPNGGQEGHLTLSPPNYNFILFQLL